MTSVSAASVSKHSIKMSTGLLFDAGADRCRSPQPASSLSVHIPFGSRWAYLANLDSEPRARGGSGCSTCCRNASLSSSISRSRVMHCLLIPCSSSFHNGAELATRPMAQRCLGCNVGLGVGLKVAKTPLAESQQFKGLHPSVTPHLLRPHDCKGALSLKCGPI